MDRWEMREAVKLSREIFAQAAFEEYRDAELAPGPDVKSDAEIDAFVREDCRDSNFFKQMLKLILNQCHLFKLNLYLYSFILFTLILRSLRR